MAALTMPDRVDAFRRAFPQWRAAWPSVVEEGGREVLYATWLLGADYRNRSAYYGAYPNGYLPRVLALFPDAKATPDELPLFAGLQRKRRRTVAPPAPPRILHAFSGSLPPGGDYVRCDLRQPAELACSVYDLPTVLPYRVRLVLADPPYSPADAERYGTPGVDRRRALAALAAVTEARGFLVWLDTCWPMFNKRQWVTVGRIAIIRSTNHRVRMVSIFERVA